MATGAPEVPGSVSSPGRPRARGAALLLAGFVLLTAGAGVGVPHVVRHGATVTAVVGLISAGFGLALLVAGSRRMLGGLPRPAGWAGGIGLTLGIIVGLVTFVPAVMGTHPPHAEIGATPADKGLEAESVRLELPDGDHLAAWYVPSRNGAAVVLRHGSGSTRSSVLDHASVLAEHGYGVLLTDARGQGESKGRAMAFGWYGDDDIVAALEHLATRPEVERERIGVVGMSMGAEEAIGALGADDRIHAVVAEGATGRSDLDKAWLSDEFGLRGWFQEQLEHLQYAAVQVLTPAPRPTALVDAVAQSQAPVLLIAAESVPDEVLVAERLQSIRPEGVEVWVVPGAGHTKGLATDPVGWESRVVSFLDAALLG